MEYTKSKWHGFERLDFQHNGRDTILIIPDVPKDDKKWLLKTEYFGAFPNFELEMLRRGYYVAHIKNSTRWCRPEDTDAQAGLCEFLSEKFGLYKKCMTVGMSCGGMQAVYLASKYPQYVAAMYLDAPVLNLLSCPCGLGIGRSDLYEEYFKVMGKTVSELIGFRGHPIDKLDKIIAEKIPIILICGDSDSVVPYVENGRLLAERYRVCDIPFVEILKENCDHHPHGLDDLTLLVEFAEKYY
ncbi:MAG: alpha/beta fold hydrolase [Clostridia bacterium]|nr:alpha/beta fold hydrolase [Clostridia bacterium]